MNEYPTLTVIAQSAAVTGNAYRQERNSILNFVDKGMVGGFFISYAAGRATAFSLVKTTEILNLNTHPFVIGTISEVSSLAVAGSLFIGCFRRQIIQQIKKFDDYRIRQLRK